ncbi:MAG: TetR/AcrR family transcriptional regulator [Oscillospiraceae bacterium]|nr:TetR/AcrR family transcriptional regulator [Oscillospiraceae bacterium]
MDRRQRKTREAIFQAFSELLSEKHYNQITVGEILERADVGRATFYAHFETKDYLLKELCAELFCHIFHGREGNGEHRHIFQCEAPESAFLHLIRHLQKNDYHILTLLTCDNNGLFLGYFKEHLKALVENQLSEFPQTIARDLPDSYRIHLISATFVETILWWIQNGMKESPERLSYYFMQTL